MKAHGRLVVSSSDNVDSVAGELCQYRIIKKWSAGDRVSDRVSRVHEDNGLMLDLFGGTPIAKDVCLVEEAMRIINRDLKAFKSIRFAHPSMEWQLSLYSEIENGSIPPVNLSVENISVLASLKMSFDFDISQ